MTEKDDSKNISYFDDEGKILVSVGKWADEGMFILRNDDAGDPYWHWLHRDSKRYSAFHQRIYNTFRADPLNEERIKALPAVPPPPPFVPMAPPIRVPAKASDYPELSTVLKAAPGQKVNVWVILDEDLYESKYGDGIYYHFHAVCWSGTEAIERKFLVDLEEMAYGHVRPMQIHLMCESIEIDDLGNKTFDEFRYSQILAAANLGCVTPKHQSEKK